MKNKKIHPETLGVIVLTALAAVALSVQIFWDTEHPAKDFLCWGLLAAGALFFFLCPPLFYRKHYGSRADQLRLLFSGEIGTVSLLCTKSEKRLGTIAPDKKVFSVSLYDEIDLDILLHSHTLDAKKSERKKADKAFRGEVKIDLRNLHSLRGKTVIVEKDLYTAMQALELFKPLFKYNTVVSYNVLGEDIT